MISKHAQAQRCEPNSDRDLWDSGVHAMRDASPTLVEEPWFDDAVEDLPASHHGWIGRYELLCPVNAGTRAGAWLARQHDPSGLTRLVSLVTMPRDAACAELLIDDARDASSVRHGNVCEVVELGEDGAVVYLATEWVHGVSLAELLRPHDGAGGPLPYVVASWIVAEACAGLHAAHELGEKRSQRGRLVHGDISLANVMVGAMGQVKITGMGTARALAKLEEIDAAEQTRAYPSSVKISSIAPEVIAGGAYDRRGDVFSLGTVLYEATTGHPPFGNANDYQAVDALLSGNYVKPSAIVPGYPAELEAIIVRAMDRDPVRRYASADAMRRALVAFLARSGKVGSAPFLASFVEGRAGTMLKSRRELMQELTSITASGVRRVSLWSEDATPNGLANALEPTAPRSSGVDPVEQWLEASRRRKRRLAAVVGAGIALVMAGVAYLSTQAVLETPNVIVPASATAEAATALPVAATPTGSAEILVDLSARNTDTSTGPAATQANSTKTPPPTIAPPKAVAPKAETAFVLPDSPY